jgi:TonB-linked SusC/RagA family outer membrane protein
MKFLSVQIFMGILLASICCAHNLSGQSIMDKEISLRFDETPLKTVLARIEKVTGARFTYSPSVIEENQRVSIDVFDQKLASLLDELLVPMGISYKVVGDRISLYKPLDAGSQAESVSQLSPAGNLILQVGGVILDRESKPLPGANVIEKGTTNGTTTDADGRFSLNVQSENSVLVFSFIGYVTQEVAVNGRSVIDITLQEDVTSLDEVVVVGYGTQKKVNLTGSVGTVNGETLVISPATNAVAAMQGRLPGVTITQSTGAPGKEEVSILIRGLGTMNNASPMVIVDGIESSMENLSPQDIESVSVLKDASSAAIYGTRAANGVILITTKRGAAGEPQISYNTSFMWQKPTRLPRHLSSAEYAELYNEGNRNEGMAERFSAEDIQKFRSGEDPYNFPNTDWLDLLVTESGFTQDHNLSFSGGNENTKYRTSFEYFDQKGLIKISGHKRYNARINMDTKISNWLSTGVNMSLSHNKVSNGVFPLGIGGDESQYFRQTNTIPPFIANKNADGSWNRYIFGGNPIAWINEGGGSNANNNDLLGSVFAEVKLAKGLTLKGIAGVNYIIDDNKVHQKTIEYGDGTIQGPSYVRDYFGRQLSTSLQSFLNYEHSINKSNFKALLGVQREAYSANVNSAYRQDFPSNDLDQLDAGSTTGWTNSGSASEARLGSFFGRINYDYNDKYLFETNLRRDASSKFGKGNRVGWFPSMSAGWRLSEENFIKDIHWIDNMKVRASWGQLGNHSIDDYLYIQRVTLGQNYDFGGVVVDGAATVNPSNSAISWEKTSELDLGIDVDLFQNRFLSLSADYYDRLTDDILTSVPVSFTFGLDAPVVNAGAMRNKGVEVMLEHYHHIGELEYSVALNAAFNKNTVEKFPEPSKDDLIRAEGVAWNSFYGYQAIGIYDTDAQAAASPHLTGVTVKAGDLIYKDQNADGQIDGDDRVVLGNSIPEITYGFNLGLKYKGFDLSAFFQGANEVYRTLGAETFWPFDTENALSIHLDRTIVSDGKVVRKGNYPRTVISEVDNRVQSSFSVLNASYLRLKTVQLAYNLPTGWLNSVKISKARAYVSGQNLVTFTKFPSAFDPELGYSANYSYPQVKFYSVGLDITF